MIWKNLEQLIALEEIDKASFTHPILIFKHSTRCSISDVAKARLDKEENLNGVDFYYLDLIKHRDISNALAEKYNVHHESPQILIECKGLKYLYLSIQKLHPPLQAVVKSSEVILEKSY